MAEVGRFMPAGFMQMAREDAMFYFAQGRALLMVSGSWDAESIRLQTTFPVGVIDLPAPLPDDPRFSEFTLGRPSEGTTFGAAAFGLVRLSRHPEVAIDFLRFLTSAESNRELARRASERYSAILETQNAMEWLNYWTRLEVDWIGSAPE